MGDRCHRIGQTKQVDVYRLITENTIELKMLEAANRKRMLERVVVARNATFNARQRGILSKEEVASMLTNDVEVTTAEVGGINEKQLRRVMQRSPKAVASLPAKGKGYQVVTQKSSRLVGNISGHH